LRMARTSVSTRMTPMEAALGAVLARIRDEKRFLRQNTTCEYKYYISIYLSICISIYLKLIDR
jgi:hypothetical protein